MRNHFYILFQVGEASFFNYCPIVEAHVRVYAVLHEERRTETAEGGSANERALFQTRVMRLTNPNDELGGMLFLATPQTVSHRIDAWSLRSSRAARWRTLRLSAACQRAILARRRRTRPLARCS